MAAITPDAVRRENIGSVNEIIAEFTTTTINDADTWASGASGIQHFWFGQTDNPSTQASAGFSVSQSAGTFTFYPGEDGATGYLFIRVKG